jgi:hypothetical protein
MPHVPALEAITVCGLFSPQPFTFSTAVRVPLAFGVNVTLIVQCDFAARLHPEVFVRAKPLGLPPVNVIRHIDKVVFRLLVRVTFLVELLALTVREATVNGAGITVTCTTPCPVNVALCGLLGASSFTVSAPASESGSG